MSGCLLNPVTTISQPGGPRAQSYTCSQEDKAGVGRNGTCRFYGPWDWERCDNLGLALARAPLGPLYSQHWVPETARTVEEVGEGASGLRPFLRMSSQMLGIQPGLHHWGC